MGFDHLSLLVRLRGIVGEDRGAEISAVDGVMYGDSEFEAGLVSKERASDASPHRLRKTFGCERERNERMGRTNVQAAEPYDVRLGRAGKAGKPGPNGIGRLGHKFLGWVRRHIFVIVGLEWGKRALRVEVL